jgi:hypothetical protein
LDSYGFEVTDEILSFDGYSLFMTSSNLDKADENILLMGNQWLELERFSNDFKFIPITAASSDVIDRISIDLDLKYKFYSGDEIMLKTMIRSNPGFIMIKNGTILAKWSYRDFPQMENWNSKWPELIQQFMEEQDPEIMMLIEEGFMDDLNWDMIDFDETAHPLLMKSIAKQGDKQTWIIFIFSLVLLLFIANSLSIKKR